jgi:hypothetical protein
MGSSDFPRAALPYFKLIDHLIDLGLSAGLVLFAVGRPNTRIEPIVSSPALIGSAPRTAMTPVRTCAQ